MKRNIFLLLLSMCIGLCATAQNSQSKGENEGMKYHNVSANQEFWMFVYDNNDNPINLLEGRNASSRRGFWSNIWKAMKTSYSSTAIGTITNASSSFLTSGIGIVVDGLRSKKNDWLQQVRRDCVFTRTLPMQQDIVDFYDTVSCNGALDPDGIVFNGFGCQQFLKFKDAEGKTKQLLVFDMKCSLRQDDYGKSRMLHHGKFEVVLDRIIFNPYLCNLPNDSLTEENIKECRTPFDFQRRKNLKFQIVAEISSSWVNEAIQIVNDQKLGEFVITASIPDSTYLCNDGKYEGYFVYDSHNSKEGDSLTVALNRKVSESVSVSGECFLVPRSYIGCDNAKGAYRTWGTGMYKVNMTLNESCDVNMDFYYDNKSKIKGKSEHYQDEKFNDMAGQKHHWNRYRWSEEWKRIKLRKQSNNIFSNILQDIKTQYGGNKWVNVIVDPVVTTVVSEENKHLSDKLSKWLKLGDETARSGSPN